jgi:hydrogenase maturation protease
MIERDREHVLVIGYGSLLRGDDAVGRLVADVIARKSLPHVTAISTTQLVPELAAPLAEVRAAIFIDASASEESREIEVQPLTQQDVTIQASHSTGPKELLSLTRECYGRSPHAWLVAVPAAAFSITESLSPTARDNVVSAVHAVEDLLAELLESEAVDA